VLVHAILFVLLTALARGEAERIEARWTARELAEGLEAAESGRGTARADQRSDARAHADHRRHVDTLRWGLTVSCLIVAGIVGWAWWRASAAAARAGAGPTVRPRGSPRIE
jgi:hypothetical protein